MINTGEKCTITNDARCVGHIFDLSITPSPFSTPFNSIQLIYMYINDMKGGTYYREGERYTFYFRIALFIDKISDLCGHIILYIMNIFKTCEQPFKQLGGSLLSDYMYINTELHGYSPISRRSGAKWTAYIL